MQLYRLNFRDDFPNWTKRSGNCTSSERRALSHAPPVISRGGSFKGANTDKSPLLPPRIPASEAADNSSVSAVLTEDFWGGQLLLGWSLRENSFIWHRPLLTHQMGTSLQTTVNKWKDGCWKREGHIWTLDPFEIPQLMFRFVAQDRPRHPHNQTH